MGSQGVEQPTGVNSFAPEAEWWKTNSRALSPSVLSSKIFTHKRYLIALAAVLLLCTYLRFAHLDWGAPNRDRAGFHPDEQIVASIANNLAADHFDTDMSRAPLPSGLQGARYNFSSYHYAAYLWHVVAVDILRSKAPAILIYRRFSASLGVLTCLLVYGCARRFLAPPFAILATLITGVLPLLVQDSHYARAETFTTAGTVAVLWLSLILLERCSYRRCFWTGALAGLLIACKASLIFVAVLPAAAVCVFYWPRWRANLKAGIKQLGLLAIAGAAGFVAGVPYIVPHWRIWWEGWLYLKKQYGHPFPPYGTDPPSYSFGPLASYFLSTWGVPLFLLAMVGAFGLFRKRQYVLLLFLTVPAALYYLLFGLQVAFFERNLSHVAPWVAFLAACGCAEVWPLLQRLTPRRDWQWAGLAVITGIAIATPLALSWRLAVVVLSGRSFDNIVKYESVLHTAYPDLPLVADELWAPDVLGRIHEDLASHPGGFILKLGDGGDELSRHQRALAERIFPMHFLVAEPGHFADLPVSTLQMYHSENYSWYLVRP